VPCSIYIELTTRRKPCTCRREHRDGDPDDPRRLAATTWGLAAIFPWFSLAVALACVGAGTMGLRSGRVRPAVVPA
jgi:hypothetical protein